MIPVLSDLFTLPITHSVYAESFSVGADAFDPEFHQNNTPSFSIFLQSKILMRALTLVVVALFNFASEAIVIRHDKTDQEYRATVSDFPPLATFYVDGAHGTLIEPGWVVTAAHASFCIRSSGLTEINGKRRKIDSLYVHPEYTPGKSHDIALVKLAVPVKDVTPANIHRNKDELGKDVWFIGIGGTGHGLSGQTIDNAANNRVLRKAQNRVTHARGPLLHFKFDQGAHALPLEGVSGNGDSGGPAYIKVENGYEIVGVSSRFTGGKTGEYGITEIYSRLSFFSHWIDSIIRGSESDRTKLALNKLPTLPAGLSEDTLPMICNEIILKEDSTVLRKSSKSG